MDSKSIGLWPQGFESPRCRIGIPDLKVFKKDSCCGCRGGYGLFATNATERVWGGAAIVRGEWGMGVDTGHPQGAGIRAAFCGIRACCFHATMGQRGHPRSFPLVSVHPHLLFPYNYGQVRASALNPLFLCLLARQGQDGCPPRVVAGMQILLCCFAFALGQLRAKSASSGVSQLTTQ